MGFNIKRIRDAVRTEGVSDPLPAVSRGLRSAYSIKAGLTSGGLVATPVTSGDLFTVHDEGTHDDQVLATAHAALFYAVNASEESVEKNVAFRNSHDGMTHDEFLDKLRSYGKETKPVDQAYHFAR